ncbi:MAG: hypothetical protein JWQ57_3996, partial [Mucilaginibacter sp.]|nr:hypothetical protein [Mucilaginibacter sp.]
VSVLHNYNPASVPGPGFAESTASVSLGSFINTDILDAEYTQDPPVVKSADGSISYTYTAAPVSGSTITGTTTNAGRFVYFASGGTVNPLVKINGALTFSAMGSGTIDVQIIATNNMKVQFSRTFTLNSSAFQDYGWYIKDLYPQTEYIIAVMFNGGNSSVNASAQFKKNLCLTLQQAGMSGEFTRYRADVSSLIGNVETGWYGWDYNTNTAKKKYIQHSAYARMRFQTDANKIAIEYVRDFYDRRVLNLFPLTTVQNGKDFDAAGNVVAGVNVINNAIKVTGGKTYTISGLQTHSPTYVFYNNGVPLAAPAALTPVAGSNPLAYTVTAPATANTLGLLVQRIVNTADYSDPANDTYFVYSNCMVQEGAYGTMTQYDGAIPTPFIAYAGDLPSHISGPAVFINGSLYKYYQVEGNDVAKQLQFISDDLPPGTKTVEVMMPGQGTYSDNNNVLTDPHIRRGGTFLRAVYFPSSNTTAVPATTVKAGSVLFIHDSILSGFNISSDAQNNVWMMKLIHDPTLAFTGDVYSEGYAGRILHTDTRNDANNNSQIPAFAQKLAAYNVNKYWFQIGVNDYGFMTPLHQFYSEYKSLVEQLNAIRAGAKMYIQGIGPDAFEGPNAETYADNGLATTGPTANDFRDVQRAIATTHSYCEYVNFEGLFAPTGANLADGIHPTDAGNQLYANGVKSKSTLLGTTVAAAPLAFYRNTLRSFVQNVPTVSVVTATGGKTPYVFSLVSGTLPAGLQFNPDGVITGTPTQSGTVTLTVNVADANNTNVAQNFSFTVNPVPGVVVAPLHLQNAQVGVLYKKQLYGALGYGKYTLTHTGTLPPGITLNDNTGILTGTPTASRVAPYTFSVKAVDHWGFFGTTNYSLTVGTTTPAMLSDNFTVTAAVSPSNHLLLTGHLNDIYTTTLYTFIEAYFTPAGGSEIFLGGKNVNIDAGLKDGVTVDMGAMG